MTSHHKALLLVGLLILPFVAFAQTNSSIAQTNNATPSRPEDVKKLEAKFQKFLKDKEVFRNDIKVSTDFKPEKNWYDASIELPQSKLEGEVDGNDALKKVGDDMTGVLCIALAQFLKSNGMEIKFPTQISSFLFVTWEGVTGKKTTWRSRA